MPSRKSIVLMIAVAGFVLLGLELVSELRGPNAEEGYRRIFGQSPPDHVYDLRIKYGIHLKGNTIYLGFRTQPENLESTLGFALYVTEPMYFVEEDSFVYWQEEEIFHELFQDNFPNKKKLRSHRLHLPDEWQNFVISPDTGHVFCRRLIDSDIDL